MKEITLENIIELMEKSYSLYYVDYRDSFDESLEKVQEAIHIGCYSPLDEMIFDWETGETIDIFIDELKNEIELKYNLEIEEGDELIEKYRDEIVDTIYDRNDSNPTSDLLRNTSEQVFMYDTGVYIDDTDEALKVIKETFNITSTEEDEKISMMINQTYSGGRLVVYFNDKIDNWIGIDDKIDTINFNNPMIAIVDNWNGSGDHCELKNSFSLPFNKENLFLDKTINYSYTYDVCGMYSNWCDGTEVSLSTTNQDKPEKSGINDHIEKEKELDKTYKAGGCTFGDMNISRHRNSHYINNYPCGTKCKDCGTFWID